MQSDTCNLHQQSLKKVKKLEQQFFVGSATMSSKVNRGWTRDNGRRSWKRRHIVEEFGEFRETSSSRLVCGSIFFQWGQKRRGSVTMLRERSKKEHKVSGSGSLYSGRPWSMPEEMKTWSALQKICAEVEGRAVEGTETGKSSEWASVTVRDAHEKVVKEEAGRLGIVWEILRKSTDFLRRVIAPVGGSGGVTLYTSARIASFPVADGFWWVSNGKKHCSWCVCNLWRKKWMENSQQGIGTEKRWSEGFQSTCDPARTSLEIDQCAQAAGKTAGRWWQPASKTLLWAWKENAGNVFWMGWQG